jgi:parallel beta-helix repeat protein
MQKYQNAIQDVNGNAVAGATVAVYLYGTTTPATIYSDNGITPIVGNSVTTSSVGEFFFYAANGRYSLTVTAVHFTSDAYNDITLFDPTDDGAAAINFLQAGTGAVVRTVQSKERDVVSVKDFGAVGDGVTDDTAAIQAAVESLATGSTLYFPDGTYLVSSAVLLSGSAQNKTGLTFSGNSAVIQLAAAISNQNVAEIVSGTNYKVCGLTFKGNKGTVTTPGTDSSYRYFNGLYVGAVAGKTLTNVAISGCRFTNCAYDGLMLGSGPVQPGNILPGVDNVTILGCQFDLNEVGLSGGAYRKVTISDNAFIDNDIYGVLADSTCGDVSISGNTIKTGTTLGATNAGIFVYAASQIAIIGNSVEGGKVGVLISTGASDFTISGNTVSNCATSGIVVTNSTRGVISGNAVASAAQYGIAIQSSSSQVSINANSVRSCGFDGIYLSATSSSMLQGNECVSNNGSGIYSLGSSSCSLVANLCLNNNVNNASSTSSGIRLGNTTAFSIVSNRCFDSNGSPLQNYGLLEEGSTNQNSYVSNNFSTNKTADTLFVGAANTYVANGAAFPQIRLSDGAVSAPSFSFANETNTGLYRAGTNVVNMAIGGAPQAQFQYVSGAINYPVLRGSTGSVAIFPDGTGNPINFLVQAKGTGGVQVASSGQSLAFMGGAPTAKQTVTGSRSANAAVASLLTVLANHGLLTDSTTI